MGLDELVREVDEMPKRIYFYDFTEIEIERIDRDLLWILSIRVQLYIYLIISGVAQVK